MTKAWDYQMTFSDRESVQLSGSYRQRSETPYPHRRTGPGNPHREAGSEISDSKLPWHNPSWLELSKSEPCDLSFNDLSAELTGDMLPYVPRPWATVPSPSLPDHVDLDLSNLITWCPEFPRPKLHQLS